MPDLDYAKITGRFALTVGDGPDGDDDPDVIYCDGGTVLIEPLVTYTKVAGGSPVPFTAGHSVISATIDANGYLTFNGKRYVYVVDLTSDKVNPTVGPNKATHKITFVGVTADGTTVNFETVTVRVSKLGADGDGVNDLTIVSPVSAAPAQPIYRGETGTGVASATIDAGDLLLELSDGTELNAGALPVGPGGSDAGVAGYLGNPASASYGAVVPLMAALGDARAALKTDNLAYIDFTNKSLGVPPGVLDSGQVVDYHFNAGGREPRIVSGVGGTRLAHDTTGLTTGGLADYYQSDFGAPITRIGVEYTQPAGANDGNGSMCYAAWNGIYEGGGTNVPKSWVHMVFQPGTGTTGNAMWYVCDGIGHLFVVKQQAYTNPAADDSTRWPGESMLDVDSGIAWSYLPDGSLMTLTDAEIAAMCTTLGYTVVKFSDLSATVAMCEHYANQGASTALFPRFTGMYADTATPTSQLIKSKVPAPRTVARALAAVKSQPINTPVIYAPTAQLSVASTTAAQLIDGTNVKIVAKAGLSGRLTLFGSLYVEGTAADIVFFRAAGTQNGATRVLGPVSAGSKNVFPYLMEFTGLTPGQTVTQSLQFWTVAAGSAVVKAGGSGAGMLPPITIQPIAS